MIDGVLNEDEYKAAPHATGFIQRDPDEGKPATQETDIWIAYDDAALYIGAKLHDRAPDSIISKLARRDAFISSDYFYVGIDSYHDHRTGFYFYVFPSGMDVQVAINRDGEKKNLQVTVGKMPREPRVYSFNVLPAPRISIMNTLMMYGLSVEELNR